MHAHFTKFWNIFFWISLHNFNLQKAVSRSMHDSIGITINPYPANFIYLNFQPL